jgi:chemotaxis methyl-accepting protein methylase
MARFVDALTHNAGSPFREPQFFAAFHQRVLPRLRTFSLSRTGCALASFIALSTMPAVAT